MEALNQLIIAHDLRFISEDDLLRARAQIERIGRMISGLYRDAKA